MKVALVGVMALAAVTLAACSPTPNDQASSAVDRALSWEAPGAERVPCSELLAEWSDGEYGSPAACWRYVGSFDSAQPFRAQLASFTEYMGVEPLSDPTCMPHAGGDFSQCEAVWKTDEGYLKLSSGINIEGLRASLKTPGAEDLVHELLIHTSTTDPRTDDDLAYLNTPLP